MKADVTKRKQGQGNLRDAEEQYRIPFELGADAKLVVDFVSGDILDANAAAAELWGYSRNELLKMKSIDLSAEPEKTKASQIKAASTGMDKVPVRYHRKKDGTVFPVEIHVSSTVFGGRQVLFPSVRDISERLKEQETLANREAELQSILETIPDYVWVKSVAGKFLSANSSFCRFLGISKPDIVGKSDCDFVPNELADLFRMQDELAIQTGRSVKCEEVVFDNREGSLRTLETVKSPMYDANGNLVGVLGIARDMTERKQTDKALQESEARLREVLEHSLDASYKRNIQSQDYEYLSPVFAEISGYTPEEMKDLPIETVMDLIHPDDLAEVERVIEHSMIDETTTEHHLEYRFKHKQGHYVWFYDKFIVLRDDAGQPFARIGSVGDITRRKQMEMALFRSEEKNRMMLANISDVTVIFDKNGVVLYQSPNIEKRFGWDANELIGKECWGFVHPKDLARVEEHFFRLVETENTTVSMEIRFKCKDESYKDIELTATNLLNDPVIKGVLVNYRDISEKRQAEQMIRAVNERRQKNELLNALIERSHPPEMLISQILRFFGGRAGKPYTCMVVCHDKHLVDAKAFDLGHINDVHALTNATMDVVESADRIVWESPRGVAVLDFALEGSTGAVVAQKKLAAQLHEQIFERLPELDISIGIAEMATNLVKLDEQYHHAIRAVETGRKVRPQQKIHHFEEMGAFQILSRFQDQVEMDEFIERTLGPLLHYEGKSSADFLLSLEMFLLSENLKESADNLSIHYQTLLFRKRRVEEILGVSLKDPSTRMSILTALHLLKLKR